MTAQTDEIEIDINTAIIGAMDVAKVSLGSAGGSLSNIEAAELLHRLMTIIDRTMPADLQAQDIRVITARIALDGLKQ